MVPLVGDLHHKDNTKRCASIDYEQDAKDYRVWELTHRYTNEQIPGGGIGGDSGAQPFGNVRRTWEPVDSTEQIYFDLNDHPIIYFNQRPFTITRPTSIFRLKITRDEYNTPLVQNGEFNGTMAQQYHNHLNSDTVSGAPEKQVRLKIKATENIEGGTFRFWTIEYDLDWNPKGWNPEIIEADFYQLAYFDSSTSTYNQEYTGHPETAPADEEDFIFVPIIDGNGERITVPALIDTYGRKIHSDYAGEYAYATTWEIYELAAFGDLNLPV